MKQEKNKGAEKRSQIRPGTFLQNLTLTGSDHRSGFKFKTFWQSLDFSLWIRRPGRLTRCASCWGVCPCGRPVWSSAPCPGCSWGRPCGGTRPASARLWLDSEPPEEGGRGWVSKRHNRYRIISVLSSYQGTKSINNHQSWSKLWKWQSAVDDNTHTHTHTHTHRSLECVFVVTHDFNVSDILKDVWKTFWTPPLIVQSESSSNQKGLKPSPVVFISPGEVCSWF